MPQKSVIVYWLIPAKAERELFRALIRILAKQCAAPVFEPHLTLCFSRDAQSPKKVLRRISAPAVRLQVRDVAYSSKFTKTLFIRLKPKPALNKLTRDLGGDAPRDPHVSLIYKKLSARTKKQLAATIRLPFRSVSFDAIKAVRCISPATTGRDVQSWRVVAMKRLG
jgi:2'-5' RNA ligase